jgi:hypothetical protein
MKSRVLFLLVFAVSSVNVSGQNLVPNGSFEEYSECPLFLGELESKCDFWYGSTVNPEVPLDQNPTPDWYHSCGINGGMQPPDVALGYQLPSSGDGIAGLIVYRGNNTGYREFMGSPLVQSLDSGVEYTVKFNIVCDGELGNKIAVDKLGFKFTTYPTFNSIEQAVDDFAHGTIDQIISDTLQWYLFDFDLIADSAYSYIHLGLFYSEASLDTSHIEGSVGINSYYFIDEVSVEPSTLQNSQIALDQEFIIFPNPASSRFIINHSSQLKILEVQIIDLSGRIALGFKGEHPEYDISTLSEGLYTVILRLKRGNFITKQLLIQK